MPASKGAPNLEDNTEAAVPVPGAAVWTVKVELPLPPETVAGENVQVVFAGACVQERATGRLKPVPGVMVTL
jgi:hypothetical protein